MKNLCFIVAFLLSLFTACKNMEPESYQTEIAKMNDSLFKALPSVKRVSVEVKTDFGSELNITLGDKILFHAADSNRENATETVTRIAKKVFGSKLPGKGKVIFVEEENTIDVQEGKEKTIEIRLESK